jgi:hypothetical protein
LNAATVQAAVSGFAGEKREFRDVERAIAALESAYRKRGFSLVKVILPEQELIPRNPVVQFTPPPAFSSSISSQVNSATSADKSNNVDCQVR